MQAGRTCQKRYPRLADRHRQKNGTPAGRNGLHEEAEDAKRLGYLLRSDTVVVNPDHLIWAAREKALEMAEGYRPPRYRDDLKLPGVGARYARVYCVALGPGARRSVGYASAPGLSRAL